MNIDGVEVSVAGGAVTWTSGLEIDADGSPRAYAPIGSGVVSLDYLGNAGSGTKWPGLVCNDDGVPYVQGPGDPFPGAYVSGTALQDPTYQQRDPRRYVDPERVPYISIPPELFSLGVRKGDLASVSYGDLRCGAIVADVGPHKRIGEGSVLLCQILGVDPFRLRPHHKLAGIDRGVSFRVFLKSASVPPWPRDGIEQAVAALYARA